jgi:hypothetical protein
MLRWKEQKGAPGLAFETWGTLKPIPTGNTHSPLCPPEGSAASPSASNVKGLSHLTRAIAPRLLNPPFD